VSHNEPLCFKDKVFDRAYAKEMYEKINDFGGWINSEIMTSLKSEALDNVGDEIAKTETITK